MNKKNESDKKYGEFYYAIFGSERLSTFVDEFFYNEAEGTVKNHLNYVKAKVVKRCKTIKNMTSVVLLVANDVDHLLLLNELQNFFKSTSECIVVKFKYSEKIDKVSQKTIHIVNE